jgi:hypothetical protein
MNKEENTSNWGFVSADGFFQPISSLNTENLEYAYKSLDELQLLLQEKVQLELYEQVQ